MAVLHGWAPFNVGVNTASGNLDLGHIVNSLSIKNTDASTRIWIRIGDTPQVAVASAVGANRSYPLAAGESIDIDGIMARYIAHISDSGTVVMKGLGVLISYPVRTLRKM